MVSGGTAGAEVGLLEENAGARRRGRWWRSLLKLLVGLLLVQGLLVAGYRLSSGLPLSSNGGRLSVSDAEQCLQRGTNVYFTVTFGSDDYLKKIGEWERAQARSRMAQAFVVTANTHVGSVKDIDLEDRVFLKVDGVTSPAADRPLESTVHHNTFLVFFPRFGMQGEPLFEKESGSVEVVIRDVEVPERFFLFQNPIGGDAGGPSDLVRWVMLLGVALAGLLVACTPCLVGSLAVGALAVGTSASADAKGTRFPLLKQTLVYLGALSAGYIAVALAVQFLGLQAEDLRPFEFAGGLLLLVLGANYLRSQGIGRRLLQPIVRTVRSLRRGPDQPDEEGDRPLGSGGSTAMGASLAMVCSVAGAPTLTTSILLPTLVYAGLSDFQWVIAFLLVYLAISSLPFLLIAVGLGEVLLRASIRMGSGLRLANGLLLSGLGLLLLVSPSVMADALAVPARALLAPFGWLL